MPSILIAGIGRLGSRLAEQLVTEGWKVYGLRRGDQFPAGVEGISCDLLQDDLSQLPKVDYLVFCAAPARGQQDGYLQTYLAAMDKLLSAIEKQSLKHAIFTSSTAVYGQNNGEIVDETSLTEPVADNGKIMLQAEQQFIQHLKNKATVVRMAGLYGSSRFLIDQIIAGKPFNGNSWTNRIHLDDAAGVCGYLLKIAEMGSELETIYNGVDAAPVLSKEVRGWIAERLALDLNMQLSAPANKQVSSKKIQEIGYQFKYKNFKQGMLSLFN
ncbi:SDR family oxidoreductase [Pelagibaculum spongiae]|nr:SDR family oxidoreductase [Pelagibaculum spongiae]